MSLSLTVPVLHISGNYDVNGKVFLFGVNGKGPFTTTLEGVTGVGTAMICLLYTSDAADE